MMVRDTLADLPDEDTFIGALRPLTARELQAVVAGTTTDRVSIKAYLASTAVALLLLLILPVSLKPYAFLIAIIVLVLLVLKILGHVTNRDVRRDIATGQKVVINGFVEERLVNHIELMKVHSMRVRTAKGTSETFPVADDVYNLLQVNDEVELACLPLSRTLVSLRTRRVYWTLGNQAGET